MPLLNSCTFIIACILSNCTVEKRDGIGVNSNIIEFIAPVFIEPSVALSYVDDNHVDYYYGVAKHEVNDQRTVYNGKSALNTSIGLSVSTPIFFEGFTRLAVDYTWYDSNITDSPLVDSDSSYGVQLFFTKFF